MKIFRKIKEVGFLNCVIGFVRRIKFAGLIKKYKFDPWHLSPYEWRKYIQETAQYINFHNEQKGYVVDIGCGLGELLRHIKANKKVGIDMHESVIMAARELNDGTATYKVGSFDEVIEKNIDYLVTLGFMHGGTEDTWVRPYRAIAQKSNVLHFIVDTVPDSETSNFLDWSKILPDNYRQIEKMGPFLGGRYIEVWKKQ